MKLKATFLLISLGAVPVAGLAQEGFETANYAKEQEARVRHAQDMWSGWGSCLATEALRSVDLLEDDTEVAEAAYDLCKGNERLFDDAAADAPSSQFGTPEAKRERIMDSKAALRADLLKEVAIMRRDPPAYYHQKQGEAAHQAVIGCLQNELSVAAGPAEIPALIEPAFAACSRSEALFLTFASPDEKGRPAAQAAFRKQIRDGLLAPKAD